MCRGTLAEYAGRYAVANTAEAMTQAQRIASAAEAEKQLRTGYNFWADADIGLEDLGWHWRLLARIARVDKRLMCSQMTVAAGRRPGWTGCAGKRQRRSGRSR